MSGDRFGRRVRVFLHLDDDVAADMHAAVIRRHRDDVRMHPVRRANGRVHRMTRGRVWPAAVTPLAVVPSRADAGDEGASGIPCAPVKTPEHTDDGLLDAANDEFDDVDERLKKHRRTVLDDPMRGFTEDRADLLRVRTE